MVEWYPWSMLWLLFAAACAALAAGRWVATMIVILLIAIVLLHAMHLHQAEKDPRRRKDRHEHPR
jgi:hypothetical protein